MMHVAFLLILALVHQAFSSDGSHFLHKRDAPLVTVNIPLTVNKDQRYVVGVNMSSSPNTQKFNFVLAGNTGYSAVAGTSCDDCNGVSAYNSSLSTTQIPLSGSKNLTIGASSIIGPFIKENCGLHEVNGSSWLYPNQTIIVANSSNLFSDVTSGLIGLGTNANGQSGDFLDTIFGGWLTRNPTRNNFTFGMALQAPDFTSDNDTGNGGILHWVVPDSSAYAGNVTWSSASVAPTAPDVPSTTAGTALGVPESDWTITLDSWSISAGSNFASNLTGAPVTIEPFYPDIYFPDSDASALYGTISEATKLDTLIEGMHVWSIPCDTNLTVSFVIAGVSFPVGADRLVKQQSDGTCIGVVQAFADSTINNFMLGSNFISTQYLIFVIGRPGSGVPNSIGIANRAAAASKKHVGAIVGGTVGGIIGLLALLGVAFFIGRRYGRKGQHTNIPASEKYGSEEGKDVQYVTQPLMNSPGSQQSSLPTPPPTAFTNTSFRPLLPEAHTPQSPAFSSLPVTPVSPMNFVPSTPAHSSNGFGGSMISYNSAALGANMGTDGGNDRSSMSSNGGGPNTINPYILPQQPPTSSSSRSHIPGLKDVKSWRPPQEQDLAGPPSLRDIDPLSPSSGAATVEPFVLGPVPRTRLPRGDSKDSGSTPRFTIETPAPPYSSLHGTHESRMNSLRSPASATLVEYSPTTNGHRTDGRQAQGL